MDFNKITKLYWFLIGVFVWFVFLAFLQMI